LKVFTLLFIIFVPKNILFKGQGKEERKRKGRKNKDYGRKGERKRKRKKGRKKGRDF
jgi:hypothetical protein